MLSEGTVFATLAVSDMEVAKEFYGGTLGLVEVDENPGGVTYTSGDGKLFVYQSEPDVTREGDIHFMGPYKSAWFKDPDGNILNISSR